MVGLSIPSQQQIKEGGLLRRLSLPASNSSYIQIIMHPTHYCIQITCVQHFFSCIYPFQNTISHPLFPQKKMKLILAIKNISFLLDILFFPLDTRHPSFPLDTRHHFFPLDTRNFSFLLDTRHHSFPLITTHPSIPLDNRNHSFPPYTRRICP